MLQCHTVKGIVVPTVSLRAEIIDISEFQQLVIAELLFLAQHPPDSLP
jgi:hypothetical protein